MWPWQHRAPAAAPSLPLPTQQIPDRSPRIFHQSQKPRPLLAALVRCCYDTRSGAVRQDLSDRIPRWSLCISPIAHPLLHIHLYIVSKPAAPSAIPALQVLLQWLIRLGRKKQVRNLPASARHTSVKLFLCLRGRSKVRAARAGCCLKTFCACCCDAARSDLISAPIGCAPKSPRAASLSLLPHASRCSRHSPSSPL